MLKSLRPLALGGAIAVGASFALAESFYSDSAAKSTPSTAPSCKGPACQKISLIPTSLEEPAGEAAAKPAEPAEKLVEPAAPEQHNHAAPEKLASPSCCDDRDNCDHCYGLSGYYFFAGDGWKNRGDDNDNNNFGFRVGFNAGACLHDDWGYQIGASIGGYDFHGRDQEAGSNDNKIESQLFVTAGVFRRANSCSPYTFAAAIDWMHSENWGEIADGGIDLFQLRGLVGYAVSECEEVGVWSNLRLNTDSADGFAANNGVSSSIHALSQANLYWRHFWSRGAETMCYVGLALDEPGEFVLGTNGFVPLNDHVALFGNFHYIIPSTSGGDVNTGFDDRYTEETWNVSFGFAFHFGGCDCKCKHSPCSVGYLPVLPVADNATFPVSASHEPN